MRIFVPSLPTLFLTSPHFQARSIDRVKPALQSACFARLGLNEMIDRALTGCGSLKSLVPPLLPTRISSRRLVSNSCRSPHALRAYPRFSSFIILFNKPYFHERYIDGVKPGCKAALSEAGRTKGLLYNLGLNEMLDAPSASAVPRCKPQLFFCSVR